ANQPLVDSLAQYDRNNGEYNDTNGISPRKIVFYPLCLDDVRTSPLGRVEGKKYLLEQSPRMLINAKHLRISFGACEVFSWVKPKKRPFTPSRALNR
ncbi:MAG: hypothetical protein J7K85_01195, partial [Anaerolineaceae bacterium]|nr:hypothetical protein [Anaerolineaceae bacterium]